MGLCVVRKACRPFAESGLDKFRGIRMRMLQGAQQFPASAAQQLVLDGLRDEPSSTAFELVDAADQGLGQRDSDSFGGPHDLVDRCAGHRTV